MSTTAAEAESLTEPVPDDLNAKQAHIYRFLRENAGSQTYFKSRLIAEELDLSAKEVGTNMPAVRDAGGDIEVEKWGYSSGTTWMVTT